MVVGRNPPLDICRAEPDLRLLYWGRSGRQNSECSHFLALLGKEGVRFSHEVILVASVASEAQLSDNRFILRGDCGAVNAAVDMATKKMAGFYLG